MDSNELEIMLRLESVFMPYAAARREKIYKENGRFVHYTSAENALRIIHSKQIWMRNARCMADYKLSPGAKLTYAMLLKYAWQNDFCFPGQERLAKDMGVTDRSVRTYLKELEEKKFVGIKQRGLGKPNLYELNLLPSSADRKNFPVKSGRK